MNLRENEQEFKQLAAIAAEWKGIPEDAVRRDYFIVEMLGKLEQSEYADECVFKGGTSLSKCYPGTIERFSEDIDLTYVPHISLKNKQYSRALKQIEKIMSDGAALTKIPGERNDRNKSGFVVWDGDERSKIKLEIGSSVRPDPYEKRIIKTYIQEYLESRGMDDVIEEYQLQSVAINTLCVERTFLDKVMAVKRHACCGTLDHKVRHIYDVVKLYDLPAVRVFLQNVCELKRLLALTKETDSFYLEKREVSEEYDPMGAYDFNSWKKYFDDRIRKRYEELHQDLLYTNEKQDFAKAIVTFQELSDTFKEIGE